MPSSLYDDIELTRAQVQALSSAEQLAAFFTYLHYPAELRLPMTAEALGLNADLARAVTRCERLTRVDDGAALLEVYLFELKAVTMATTQSLARAFRNRAGNFLLILTADYEQLDFVLLEREIPGLPGTGIATRSVQARPRVLSVERRKPDAVSLRVLRRFTLTEYDADGEADAAAQYDKLNSAYTIAEWSEPFFNNRALFSDYYLNERLPNLPAWNDAERNRAFRRVREAFAQARRRFSGKPTADALAGLIRPLLETLGFRVEADAGGQRPDFRLYTGETQTPVAFALAYAWNRYLDGKDEARDTVRPEENPGAQVVSLLEAGVAPWAIVTNGKTWRLYSARAHSRATNYYEIDLEETLASPDPGEAFRYFYLFFRAAAFAADDGRPATGDGIAPFLDRVMEESAIYARELGERLKERVFEEIFPHFAEGFIAGLGGPEALLALPEAERDRRLEEVFQGTLTFLYRLLFLLYAESRDLLPVRETHGYYQVSLQRLKAELAERAGRIEDEVPLKLAHYSATANDLYERLLALFKVVDGGSAATNVPVYNGGLFMTAPAGDDASPEARDARFLLATRMPDRYLALGLDRLSRDIDPKRGDLAFIDYKSLGVRQLGSIYEGLLEFKVRVAPEPMAVVKGKKAEEVLPYAEAKRQKASILTEGRGRSGRERVLPRGAVYLENDRRERKATGSYYTPDYIVKYIVRQTVGPVLDEKLAALRPRLREAEQRYHATLKRKRELEGVRDPNRYALFLQAADAVLRELFDVKILDPAMGSGHFLVEAVDYVTDRLVQFLDGFPFLSTFFEGMRAGILEELARQGVSVDPARLTDVTLLKRHVLKRCIYGVDLNPMAVELAKVSLWLDCFTLGAPLSFLDHHLRCGNSLIGAMAREVAKDFESELPLFGTGPFSGLLSAAQFMQEIAAKADVTLEQVKESAGLFGGFEQQATPYKRLLDIYVARHFGVKHADDFLRVHTPEQALALVRDDVQQVKAPYRAVIEQARALYQEKRFFHWDLEFPEVFIDLEHAAWKEDGGFDAVVGNPPYSSKLSTEMKLLTPMFRFVSYRCDPFAFFMERGLSLLRLHGFLGYIVPSTWTANAYYEALRRELIDTKSLRSVLIFQGLVFEDANVDTSIVTAHREGITDQEFLMGVSQAGDVDDADWLSKSYDVVRASERFDFPPFVNPAWDSIFGKMYANAHRLLELASYISLGLRVASVKQDTSTQQNDDYPDPLLLGDNIERYVPLEPRTFFNAKTVKIVGGTKRAEVYETHPKILMQSIRNLSLERRLVPTLDYQGLHFGGNVVGIILKSNIMSAMYFLSLLASTLVNEFFAHRFITISMTSTFLGEIPIRRIAFTTPAAERARLLAEGQALYARMSESASRRVGESRTMDYRTTRLFNFVQARLDAQPEQADVIHDLLAHLTQQMLDLNKQKQAEQQRFFAWLEAQLQIQPDKKGRTGLDALSGKTTLWGYLGDYQKGEPETAWDAVETVLHKNRRQLGVELAPALLASLRREYAASLDVLRPIKARLALTDGVIDGIVYQLYGLTAEEIAVVEGRPPEEVSMPSRTIGRESDPRVLAKVLTILQRHGALSLRRLQEILSERGDNLGTDKAVTIRREFEFLQWLQPQTENWALTESGQRAAREAGRDEIAFARHLAVTHDQYTHHEISRLLNRMWVLNPQGQGTIIIPQPVFGDLPAKLVDVRPWLLREMERWNRALKQQMPHSPVPDVQAAVEHIVTQSLSQWEQRSESERRSNLLKAVGDRYWEAMFGYLMTAGDLRIWQNRLDWAAITHTAYRLPGIPAQVWFPVGAFRETAAENFTAVEGLVFDGQTFYRYTPHGPAFYEQFGQVLYEGYRQKQLEERVEYVSLLAARDWVCYRLRISHTIFETTLQEVFPLALRGDLPYNLALEVDVTPQERRIIEQSRERPIIIDATPRYIIAMRLRK